MTKAMGAPVETGLENFEEAILKLSVADRVKLIHWISESVVEEETGPPPSELNPGEQKDIDWPPKEMRVAEDLSGKVPWYGDFDFEKKRTEEERKQAADEAWGAWADWAPEDLADQILSARTTGLRELPRYE